MDSHQSAQSESDLFARSDLDLLICYVGTYATSSTVLPVVQRTRAPVLVLNLQPVAALDYESTDTGLWLESCCARCVPEISNAFARARIQFSVVSRMLFDDARAWTQIRDWVRAATVKRTLSRSRIGFLGQTYPGMMDMYSQQFRDFLRMPFFSRNPRVIRVTNSGPPGRNLDRASCNTRRT